MAVISGFDALTWFAGICKDCGCNVVITQPDQEQHPTDDYWWYCSNKKCENHHPGDHTGDMEWPDWVEEAQKKEPKAKASELNYNYTDDELVEIADEVQRLMLKDALDQLGSEKDE